MSVSLEIATPDEEKVILLVVSALLYIDPPPDTPPTCICPLACKASSVLNILAPSLNILTSDPKVISPPLTVRSPAKVAKVFD